MAPRQLRLELNGADTAADKGSKRALVDSIDKSSTQAREVCAAKTPSGVAAPPYTTTASAVHYNTLRDTLPSPMALTTTSFCTQQIVPASTKKKLVRLKKPRLPSALGLSGAGGEVAIPWPP
eukprot:scaffold16844_cov119-Isochrysis_galbana.AAC.10